MESSVIRGSRAQVGETGEARATFRAPGVAPSRGPRAVVLPSWGIADGLDLMRSGSRIACGRAGGSGFSRIALDMRVGRGGVSKLYRRLKRHWNSAILRTHLGRPEGVVVGSVEGLLDAPSDRTSPDQCLVARSRPCDRPSRAPSSLSPHRYTLRSARAGRIQVSVGLKVFQSPLRDLVLAQAHHRPDRSHPDAPCLTGANPDRVHEG